jgi:tRNA(Ile)-lysidine synthase
VLSSVLRTIRDHDLLAAGDRVLVAVSGGPDSTALLDALVRLSSRLDIKLAVACVDHGLRPESADEAQTVGLCCGQLGLACEVLAVDVKQARRSHVSLQEAARNVRLAALESAAARLGCAKIALGHTADDQAETVLFRIVRGTGIAGLAGIPYRRGSFIRPLLDVRRSALLGYLAKRKIEFLSDPSNANRRYSRSRIRHDILPMLARENPRVVESLLALAREARATGRTTAWRESLPPGLFLPRRVVECVERLVRDGRGSRRIAVKDGEVVVAYGNVAWQPSPSLATEEESGERSRTISAPGTYRLFDPPAPAIEITSPAVGPRPGGKAACFDTRKVRWPFGLRTLRPGDRMSPRSGLGTRKLSDLLVDAKIPRQERARLPALCDAAGEILFVPGLRPSQVARPDANTIDWIEVRVAR